MEDNNMINEVDVEEISKGNMNDASCGSLKYVGLGVAIGSAAILLYEKGVRPFIDRRKLNKKETEIEPSDRNNVTDVEFTKVESEDD